MADNASLFKLTAKSYGLIHGVIPSFMAKPHNGLPGCSGHVHISLRDKNGKNVFAVEGERSDAKWEDTKRLSEVGEWFVAGVLRGLRDCMVCMVPNVNR